MLCLSGAILRRDKRGYTHPSCLSCRILLSSTCVSTYRVRVLYISTQLEGGGEDGGGGAEARSRRSPQRFGCRPGAIFSVYCCGPEKKYHSKSIALLVNRLRNCFSDGRTGQEAPRVASGGGFKKVAHPGVLPGEALGHPNPGPGPTLHFCRWRNHCAAYS